MTEVIIIREGGLKHVCPPTAKPHLTYVAGMWCCIAGGKIWEGKSPLLAYVGAVEYLISSHRMSRRDLRLAMGIPE